MGLGIGALAEVAKKGWRQEERNGKINPLSWHPHVRFHRRASRIFHGQDLYSISDGRSSDLFYSMIQIFLFFFFSGGVFSLHHFSSEFPAPTIVMDHCSVGTGRVTEECNGRVPYLGYPKLYVDCFLASL